MKKILLTFTLFKIKDGVKTIFEVETTIQMALDSKWIGDSPASLIYTN
jgi:hypothetical protein